MSAEDEIKAMGSIATAVDGLEAEGRARVLLWAVSHYGVAVAGLKMAKPVGAGARAEGGGTSPRRPGGCWRESRPRAPGRAPRPRSSACSTAAATDREARTWTTSTAPGRAPSGSTASAYGRLRRSDNGRPRSGRDSRAAAVGHRPRPPPDSRRPGRRSADRPSRDRMGFGGGTDRRAA